MLEDVKARIRERLEKELDDVGRRLIALRDHQGSQESEAMGDNTPLGEAADAAQVTEEREKEMQILVARGRAWRAILQAAEERDAQLIVLGVHGRNPIDVTLFGSTTQHVVRAAQCPVMVTRT
ncbi:MAG TPA: universal stress protein [Candidatus Polarisedimenticolia bacterium]|jgi:nucleotide-binding universal stress UspA family protein|nr:universal stress protein [Candidatus Polarisedimenticolia bacterium]